MYLWLKYCQISYLNALKWMDGPPSTDVLGWCTWLCTCLLIRTWIWIRLCVCEDQLGTDKAVTWQTLPAKMTKRQVPNSREGIDLPGNRVWEKLGEMAKRKCQIGASGGNVKASRPEKREGWQFETEREQVAVRHPPPFSWHPNLHRCIFNAAFPLLRPPALLAQVIQKPITLLPFSPPFTLLFSAPLIEITPVLRFLPNVSLI